MTRLGNIERELKNAELRDINIAWTAVGSVAAAFVLSGLVLANSGIASENCAMIIGGGSIVFLGLVAAIIAWLGAKRGWKKILGWRV